MLSDNIPDFASFTGLVLQFSYAVAWISALTAIVLQGLLDLGLRGILNRDMTRRFFFERNGEPRAFEQLNLKIRNWYSLSPDQISAQILNVTIDAFEEVLKLVRNKPTADFHPKDIYTLARMIEPFVQEHNPNGERRPIEKELEYYFARLGPPTEQSSMDVYEEHSARIQQSVDTYQAMLTKNWTGYRYGLSFGISSSIVTILAVGSGMFATSSASFFIVTALTITILFATILSIPLSAAIEKLFDLTRS